MSHTAQLHISKAGLRCDEVARFLVQQKILGQVASNLSSQGSDDSMALEHGCSVYFTKYPLNERVEIDRAWTVLSRRFGLGCAYVQTDEFRGCVIDYLRPSVCPSAGARERSALRE